MARYTETRTTHEFYLYGAWVKGYGPSMDPHVCGDPSEPCVTRKEQREVTSWEIIESDHIGRVPPRENRD